MKVLLVEDNPADACLLRETLIDAGASRFSLTHVQLLADAEKLLNETDFDAVLLDLSLPDSIGLDSLRRVASASPSTPVVVLSGIDDESTAVTALRDGAQDYLVKGHADGALVVRALRYAVERKETQIQLQEARDFAERANRAKSEFLAAMSHDIRTPMNAILGVADLLAEGNLDEVQQNYVDVLKAAGDTLLGLIDDILDISKLEAGRVELAEKEFALHEVIHSVCEVISVPAHERGLELVYDIFPDVPPRLIGDPARLRQILINILGNSVKFTRQGEVVLRICSDRHEPGRLYFSVHDTGEGIPPDMLENIFERYVTTQPIAGQRQKGAGLGLAIAKRLVLLMHGQIEAVSRVGEGTTMRFSALFGLPAGSQEAAISQWSALTSKRVLIVDDNLSSREALQRGIEGRGASVSVADTSSQALELLLRAAEKERPFELLLLDHSLSNPDAYELVRTIRHHEGCALRIVLMLPCQSSRDILKRFQPLAVSHYFTKPFRIEQVQSAIETAMQESVAAPEQPRPLEILSTQPVSGSLKVLLAEDCEDNQFLVRSFLSNTPYQLEIVGNGDEALRRIKQAAYDLVLMDIDMPVMDGIEATRAIRAWESEEGRAPTPIVALTAYAFGEDMDRSLAAGCDAHMTKPILKTRLLEAIEEYARREAFSDLEAAA